MQTLGYENAERKSNPIPQNTYLSGSAFLGYLTPPDQQSFKLKSEFIYRDHVSNS